MLDLPYCHVNLSLSMNIFKTLTDALVILMSCREYLPEDKFHALMSLLGPQVTVPTLDSIPNTRCLCNPGSDGCVYLECGFDRLHVCNYRDSFFLTFPSFSYSLYIFANGDNWANVDVKPWASLALPEHPSTVPTETSHFMFAQRCQQFTRIANDWKRVLTGDWMFVMNMAFISFYAYLLQNYQYISEVDEFKQAVQNRFALSIDFHTTEETQNVHRLMHYWLGRIGLDLERIRDLWRPYFRVFDVEFASSGSEDEI